MERPGYLTAAAAVMFAALCAYVGAELFAPDADNSRPVLEPGTADEGEFTELEGLALRFETPLFSPPDSDALPGDALRICADEAERSAGTGQMQGRRSALYVQSCDGFEYLSPPQSLTADERWFRSVLDAEPSNAPNSGGKLVHGFYWYFAALCPPGVTPPEPGGLLILPEGFSSPVEARLLSSCPFEDGSTGLLFRLPLGGSETLSIRHSRIYVYERRGALKLGKALPAHDKTQKAAFSLPFALP